MEVYMKAVAGILIALILSFTLSGGGKHFALLLTVGVCACVGGIALSYMESSLTFIRQLQVSGDLNGDMLEILLKSVGIGLLSEITALICADGGNAALGKVLQILSSAVILWLCIPMFRKLLELVEGILGKI